MWGCDDEVGQAAAWGDGATLSPAYDGAARSYTPVKICRNLYHRELHFTIVFLFNIKQNFKISEIFTLF